MRRRFADEGNWQARAQMFEVGATVALVSSGDEGRVVAVWPAIGMIDVQWPHTNYRHPVEDLQLVNPGQANYVAPMHETIPGGPGTSGQVSMGKPQIDKLIGEEPPLVQLVQELEDERTKFATAETVSRVALAHVKKALYWNGRDRKYRCTRSEGDSGHYNCPKRGCNGVLKPAIYKRVDGSSVKLLGCPICMFLIRRQDIIDTTDCENEGNE